MSSNSVKLVNRTLENKNVDTYANIKTREAMFIMFFFCSIKVASVAHHRTEFRGKSTKWTIKTTGMDNHLLNKSISGRQTLCALTRKDVTFSYSAGSQVKNASNHVCRM